ncbi:MAG: hypothetical protein ABIR47_03630 [Candidatus Kapaibacterium sp.]
MRNEFTPTGSDPPDAVEPPNAVTLSLDPVDRLRRVLAFLSCLRDAFDVAGREYGDELQERTWVCDYVSDEIRGVVGELEAG